jgi:Fic family protein
MTMESQGSEVEINWNGRRVRAFVPTALSDRDLDLDAATVARCASVVSDVGHAAEAMDVDYEPLARLLLRAEGVASSFIEGVSARVVDVVLAEEHLGRHVSSAAAWVASNLDVISEAAASAAAHSELTVETLCQWHRTLMTGSPTPERYVGVVRAEQNWIGGSSPLDANLVPPPPSELPRLLADLMDYVNRVDIDPIVQAASGHAQFEIIHPFGDGNGRVGRVLVAWVLSRRLSLLVPPPVSVAIASDVAGYASGLVLFRLGDHRRWITWFANAVAQGSRAQQSLISNVEEIKRRWRAQLEVGERGIRSDAAIFTALELLPRHLVLTSSTLSHELGISRKAALATLHRLATLGILSEFGTLRTTSAGQPATLFVSRDLLGLAGANPLR